MIKLYSSEDPLLVYHLKNLLENAGIACRLTNASLQSLVGEVPATDCWPQLWLLDEASLDRARAVVAAGLAAGEHSPDSWQCRQCHEHHQGQFASCWQCGAPRQAQ